jgi:hypothetical protein
MLDNRSDNDGLLFKLTLKLQIPLSPLLLLLRKHRHRRKPRPPRQPNHPRTKPSPPNLPFLSPNHPHRRHRRPTMMPTTTNHKPRIRIQQLTQQPRHTPRPRYLRHILKTRFRKFNKQILFPSLLFQYPLLLLELLLELLLKELLFALFAFSCCYRKSLLLLLWVMM